MPRDRIGVAIREDAVCGVRLRSDHIVSSTEERIDGPSDEDVQRALANTLKRLAAPRAAVAVAMGATRMQTRRLTNLPATPNSRRLRQLVHCNANAYFVKNGIPLAISGVDMRVPGEGWSSAVEIPALEVIQATCIAQSLDLELIVPAAVALAYATSAAEVSWRDGPVVATASYDEQRRLVAYRRRQCGDAGSPRGPVGAIGLNEALGATRVPLTQPLALRPSGLRSQHTKRVSNRALAAAAACLFVVCTARLLVPVALYQRLAHTMAPTAHDTLVSRAAAWTDRELATTTASLNALAKFRSGRNSISLFLAHLTEAIPREMTVLDLRIDEAGGSVTILGTRIARISSLLSEVTEISTPELSGAITTQTVGSERLERATVRFAWRGDHRRREQR